jgi:predicted ATPase/GAF domain-containing protein
MMTTLLNYTITKLIYDSPNSLVYRAVRNDDQQPVILKQLKADYPTSVMLTRYRHEFEILSQLQLPGVIRAYELKSYQNTLLLVVEDFGGDSLKVLTQQRRLTLAELLPELIQAADSLGQLHAAQVIHKDINPNNLIWNPTTNILKLIDFGIATRLPRQTLALQNPTQLEGTLPYLSPEQTGRMNRALDYRTDLYSLGVTCYELLTGQLPFISADPLEVVHGHLAKRPVPVAEVNPQIPPMLSEVVMKLMAKNAEDRYQSAFGLKYDLEQILANLTDLADLSGFKLAQHDFSTHFHLPQKLYGREEELRQLLAAFDTVVQGRSQLLLVAGYSGIGKSVLVQEVYKPITEKRGYFIAGKFDQFQRNVPYSAVVQAFRDLVRQLLTETQSQLDDWKTQILMAVGNNGQVIIELIAEVELILGPQPAVPTLPPTESQNRFNLVFQNFIKVFCQADHPLVIFLDDLQWMDSASLKLMTLMMSNVPYLLLIGAYRDNEVSPVHPLMTTIEEIQKRGSLVQTLTLTPLTLLHLNQLVSDTLHLPLAHTLPLAELVLEKTSGNPFFMGEFLKTLYVEHLLEFNLSQREWQWNLAQIKARNITANVVELMTGKIQRLPASTQTILKLAASVGNQFDLATLAVISQTSVDSVKTDLWEVLRGGLVVPLGENYKFVHDRIQQAAYSLIPVADRPALHWQIGQLLNTHLGETLGNRLFEVVDHLNQGRSLATTTEAQMPLVRLNLQAGQKAKAAAAYQAALNYLRHGLACLPGDGWHTEYTLTLTLYEVAAESAYLAGEREQMQEWATDILKNTKSILDQVNIYKIQIQSVLVQTQYQEAIALARQILLLLGVSFPQTPNAADIEAALAKTKSLWQEQRIDELANLPRMTDPNSQAIMQLLSVVLTATYQGQPLLHLLVILTMVNLSIEYGNSEQSPTGYASYGVFFGKAETDISYQFGTLALQVSEKFCTKSNHARNLHMVNIFIKPWHVHLRSLLPVIKEMHHDSLDSGELEYAGYQAVQYGKISFFAGLSLAELAPIMASYLQVMTQLEQAVSVNYLTIYWQTLLTLFQASANPAGLLDPSVESKLLTTFTLAKDSTGFCLFYSCQLFLYYLFQEPALALEKANSIEPYLAGITGQATIGFYYFYDSLVRLQMYPPSMPSAQAQLLAKVIANQAKVKHWAQQAPMNFQHKYDLVEAEKARVLGQKWEATEHYEKAMAGAHENEYLQEEALAYELAANFYLAQGMAKFAQSYLPEASYRYQRWGATAKVQHLQTQYPQFLARKSSTMSSSFSHTQMATTTVSSITSHSTGTQELDVNSIIKASQALSGEIVLQRLLEKMMHIVIENAGADTGLLLLPKAGQWFIEAEGYVGKPTVTLLQSLPIADNRLVSAALVYYVIRTQQSVVLNDATKEGNFTHDAHIVQSQVKSVLGLPLKNQGQLTGLLYLENHLTTGAFTPERLEVLNLLSSQLAISIENALLYANLEHKVAERTHELHEKNEVLVQLNQEIEEINKRLLDSIEYAKVIQSSLLPDFRQVQTFLPHSFFIWQPRDIVGGDMLYVEAFDQEWLVVVMDCTGHGVPGALMTMMAATNLRRITRDEGCRQPADILQRLNVLMKTSLQQDTEQARSDDGLDAAICLVQPQEQQLLFAGAKLPLYYLHQDQIQMIKGDKQSLGYKRSNVKFNFTTHTLPLEKGIAFYLATDGLIDQLGGTKRLPLGNKRFQALLWENRQASLEDQAQKLLVAFQEYQGANNRQDDVTVVGFGVDLELT